MVRTISTITLCIVFMVVAIVPTYAYDKAKVNHYIHEAVYDTKQAELFDRDAATLCTTSTEAHERCRVLLQMR